MTDYRRLTQALRSPYNLTVHRQSSFMTPQGRGGRLHVAASLTTVPRYIWTRRWSQGMERKMWASISKEEGSTRPPSRDLWIWKRWWVAEGRIPRPLANTLLNTWRTYRCTYCESLQNFFYLYKLQQRGWWLLILEALRHMDKITDGFIEEWWLEN